MKIRLLIPMILREYATKDDLWITMRGDTVGHLLAEVKRSYPALYPCICEETGRLRQHINLFIGNELYARDHPQTTLKPGDTVSVYQAVSGG